MTAIVKNNFRMFQAENFVESFTEASPNRTYFTIGRSEPWENGTPATGNLPNESPGEWEGNVGTDISPPSPVDTTLSEILAHDDLIAMKLVTTDRISHVIPRIRWQSGTIYQEYNDTLDDIFDTSSNPPVYVVVDDLNVYKCISNNDASLSTVEPTGQSTGVIILGDGYQWKFMFEVPNAQIQKFVNDDWIPVGQPPVSSAQEAVEAAAVDGALDFIKVINQGSGYAIAPLVIVTGNGSGATATANIAGGNVVSITITSRGSGYTNASITFDESGTGGTGVTAKSIIGPRGGHGSDAKNELGAYFVMMNIRLEQDETGDFPVDDDFRKVGILLDPLESGAGVTPGILGDPCVRLTYESNEVLDNSGRYIYTEHRRPINRAGDQTEDVKLVMAF